MSLSTVDPNASLDAIVIGAGPNGLAAAIALAQAGHSVRVYEAEHTVGGATRSAELTQPGFVHDVAATVHALALLSPFFLTLPLRGHGLEFVHPEAPFAHPMDDGTAVVVERSVEQTANALSARDGRAYRHLLEPFVENSHALMEILLAPHSIVRPMKHPLLMASFGWRGIQSAEGLARRVFESEHTRAMFAGVSAHSMVPLDMISTAGYGLGLIISAHGVGWPVARGGSQQLCNALASYLRSLGGEIVTDARITSLAELPEKARAIVCDVTPRQFLHMAGDNVPSGYADKLSRYRYGPGVFKMDWALNAPVPWRADVCGRAGTVHLGGTMEEIARSERESFEGRVPEHPYVLAVQPSRFDATRAPSGKHTLWAYCHVPNGSTVDMRERMENQIERFAPGFRDCIIERSAMFPADLERGNANLVGGDIAGGAADFAQWLARPVLAVNPYRTAVDGVYLCSSSTPPGIGVHGMCGWYAAKTVVSDFVKR
ncbi:MAG: NAD(P)/FAD-dependent oxidoreductase [Gemmatimonadaceae bacterium]